MDKNFTQNIGAFVRRNLDDFTKCITQKQMKILRNWDQKKTQKKQFHCDHLENTTKAR